MPSMLPILDCCCECDAEAPPVLVQGPPGVDGTDGTDGTDGENAFTTLTAQFTQPAVGATVPVTVTDGTFVNLGQYLSVAVGGVYLVTAKTDDTHLTLQNTGATGNLPPGNNIPNGSQVSPSGSPGQAGPPGPQGIAGNMLIKQDRAELKVMPTPPAASHPILIFLKNPEPGVNKTYLSAYGDVTPGDDESVIEPNDHLCRYFWYDL